MLEPPMPATIRPPGASIGAIAAESTRHSASRRCSGRSRVSATWPVGSQATMLSRSRSVMPALEEDGVVGEIDAGEQAGAVGQCVARAERHALAEDGQALHRAPVADPHA